RVLGLQGPQPTRLGHLETAELGLPLVERRRADPMLAAQIGRWQPGLLLVQHADDLLLREPRLPHPSASCSGGLYSNLEEIQGLRSNLKWLSVWLLAEHAAAIRSARDCPGLASRPPAAAASTLVAYGG